MKMKHRWVRRGVAGSLLCAAGLAMSGCTAASDALSRQSVSEMPSGGQQSSLTPTLTVSETPPSGRAVTGRRVDADCGGSPTPFLEQVRERVTSGTSVVTGRLKLTGEVSDSIEGSDSDIPYTKVDLTSVEVLAGGAVPTSVTAHILGGTKDGVVTTISREVQTSWAPDGQFFGTLHLQDGRYLLTGSLPVDGPDIVVLPIACWHPPKPPAPSTATHRALVFNGRSALAESGRWPSVAIASVPYRPAAPTVRTS